MHSGIVNGHQLLCYAHTVPEQNRGTASIFLFCSLSSSWFFCLCACHSGSPILFLGASIVCVNKLKRTADLIL